MSKLICHLKKNEKGSWDMEITIIQRDEDGIARPLTSCHYPRSRKTAINRMLTALWMMKPGDDFTITTTWGDKC